LVSSACDALPAVIGEGGSQAPDPWVPTRARPRPPAVLLWGLDVALWQQTLLQQAWPPHLVAWSEQGVVAGPLCPQLSWRSAATGARSHRRSWPATPRIP